MEKKEGTVSTPTRKNARPRVQANSLPLSDVPYKLPTAFNSVSQHETPTIHQMPLQQVSYKRYKSQKRNQESMPNGNHLNQTISDVKPQQMQQMSSQTSLAPRALLDPTHQVRLGNSGAWIDAAYAEVLQMKEMYAPEVVKRYRKIIEERKHLSNDPEVVARINKMRHNVQQLVRFLATSKTDLMSRGEVYVRQSIILSKSWINSFLQLDQHAPLSSQSRNEQSVIQSYGTTMSSQGLDDFSTRFLDSTHQVQLEKSSAWIDTAFEQFSSMKHTYLPEMTKAYKKLTEYKQLAADLETAAKYDRLIHGVKKIFDFLQLTKSHILSYGEVKAYQIMKQYKSLIDGIMRMQLQLQLKPSSSQSRTEKMVDPSQFYDLSTNSQHTDAAPITKSHIDNIVRGATSHPSVQVSQGKSMIQNSVRMHMDQETMSTQNLKKPVQYTNELLPFNQKNSFLAPQNSQVLTERNDLTSKKQVDVKESLLPSEGRNKIPIVPLEKNKERDQNQDLQSPSEGRNEIPIVPLEENRERDQNQDLQGQSAFSRLIQVVKSISSENLNASLRDIEAVTSATDRLGVSLDWDSKVTVKDLTNDIRTYDDGDFGLINCRPNTIASSTETECCKSGEMNRQKEEPDDKLLDEIKEINRKLIEVVVDMMNVKQGTLIRCSYSPIGPVRKTGKANISQSLFPRLILQLVISADYPRSSPTITETPPPGCSEVEEEKEMWMKAKSNFSLLIRKFSEPISLWNMVKTWDLCSRDVYREFAERHGGGSFTSSYGKWEIM